MGLVVINEGDQEYVRDDPRAEAFYRELFWIVRACGHYAERMKNVRENLPRVITGHGLPQKPILYIGHSAGCTVLRKLQRAAPVLLFGYWRKSKHPIINHPDDTFELPPSDAHFTVTDEMSEAIFHALGKTRCWECGEVINEPPPGAPVLCYWACGIA